jgi:tetratricopeptide (TPR) repeat protein
LAPSVLVVAGFLLCPGFLFGQGSDDAVDRFLRGKTAKDALTPDAVAGLKKAWQDARSRGGTVREFIHDQLKGDNEAYASAVSAFEKGDEDAAQKAFTQILAGNPGPFLKANCHFHLGMLLLRLDFPDLAAALFHATGKTYGEAAGIGLETDFYFGFALARIPDRPAAKEALGAFLAKHPRAPERYRTAATLLMRELAGEGGGPLIELSEKMNIVTRRLKREKTGEGTQRRQKEIIEIIEKLIEEMRKKENQGQGGGGGGSGSNQQPPSSPMERSQLPQGGSGKAKDLGKSPRKVTGEAWGQLKDKDRDKILQMLKKKFPSRYRELLEQYYKALAEGEKK